MRTRKTPPSCATDTNCRASVLQTPWNLPFNQPRRLQVRRPPACQKAGCALVRSSLMPIYEYYCADNHTIYQFYAKTLAQGRTIPSCPDGAELRMEKLFSPFAVTGTAKK